MAVVVEAAVRLRCIKKEIKITLYAGANTLTKLLAVVKYMKHAQKAVGSILW